MTPEASKEANFEDTAEEALAKRLDFSGEGFGDDVEGTAGVDWSMGSVGTGGATGTGAFTAPTFLFRCISKSPTCNKI